MRRSGGLPGALPVLLAAAIHVVANAVSVTTWRRLIGLAGARLAWGAAAWAWAASQLARYGLSGAQVAGRAALVRRHGVSAAAGAISALVETAWQLAITAVLVLATVPWWLPGTDEAAWLIAVAAVPAAVLVVGSLDPARFLRAAAAVAAWRPVRRLTRDRLATKLGEVRMTAGEAAGLTALFLVNTTLRLAAFVVLLAAVGGELPGDLAAGIAAYALGQLAGRLAIFAPGGLGAQEGAAALVLVPVLGVPVAVLLVATTRFAELVGELVFLGFARRRGAVSAPARAR